MAVILRRHVGFGFALLLLGCGQSDGGERQDTQASARVDVGGPRALTLRVPRAGGIPRVHAYPNTDSVVWTATDPAPVPSNVLAFDDEQGSVAYEDSRGRPVLLDLRFGTITVTSSRKLTGLASARGSAIFGITSNGEVLRTTPSGDWTWKPPRAARSVYPQPDGALLVATGTGANTELLKLFPPDRRVLDTVPFPVARQTVRTQLGDRLYLAVDSGLIALRTRQMDWAPAIEFEEPIVDMASTPSGDRIFVLTESRKTISVVDRFRDRVANTMTLPAEIQEMRVDPFGRYLLARSRGGDSLWVAAIATNRVIGTLKGAWRNDLPFVAHDGAIFMAVGRDVVLFDGETLRERTRIRDGASDFWFPFIWDGFRPRSANLDEPVVFDSVVPDTTGAVIGDTTAPPSPDTAAPEPAPQDTTPPRGFYVSFAAFLAEDRARELAGRIRVGGENAKVVATPREGSIVYRVVLGPYVSRDEAERAGRESRQSYWVYEGLP